VTGNVLLLLGWAADAAGGWPRRDGGAVDLKRTDKADDLNPAGREEKAERYPSSEPTKPVLWILLADKGRRRARLKRAVKAGDVDLARRHAKAERRETKQ
jgi:hypothetical protein